MYYDFISNMARDSLGDYIQSPDSPLSSQTISHILSLCTQLTKSLSSKTISLILCLGTQFAEPLSSQNISQIVYLCIQYTKSLSSQIIAISNKWLPSIDSNAQLLLQHKSLYQYSFIGPSFLL